MYIVLKVFRFIEDIVLTENSSLTHLKNYRGIVSFVYTYLFRFLIFT